MHKITQFWLAPTMRRCYCIEIMEMEDQNKIPLHCFTVQYCFLCHFIYFICLIIVLCFYFWQCYKFCRRRSPRDVHGNFQPIQTVRINVFLAFVCFTILFMHLFFQIEFGTIDRNNQPYNGCTAVGMCTLNISPCCIFRGCPQVPSYPIANNVIIDFIPIQQSIFHVSYVDY